MLHSFALVPGQNYPNSLKYISLFPPKAGGNESDVDDVESADEDEGSASKRKPAPLLDAPKDGAGKSDVQRAELVAKVRAMMVSGECVPFRLFSCALHAGCARMR